MPRKFTWNKWDYDLDGTAYIIAQDQCPKREDVPEWIVSNDNLSLDVLDGNNPSHISIDDIKDGWCAFQVRSDWYYDYGDVKPRGGYVVADDVRETFRMDGRQKPGWFPVWIVRLGEWY